MKARYFNIVLLNIMLLTSLFVSVYGNSYSLYYILAPPISAETPEVILQQGTAGTSTIYTNGTSAKVGVSAPVLSHYGYALESSDRRIETNSTTPVDDTEAILELEIAEEAYIFVVYNAGNKYLSPEHENGKGCGIRVNEEDVAFSWQSPNDRDGANSVTVLWAGLLKSGEYEVCGRFFAIRDGIVGIDTRQIAAFWFTKKLVVGDSVRSTVKGETDSDVPVDDKEAFLSFTLEDESVAFIVYNAGNKFGSKEPAEGKGVTINIDDVDIPTRQWQSPHSNDEANSVTIAYVTRLEKGDHLVRGRFFSNVKGSVTTVDERQLMVICFLPESVSYGFYESTKYVDTDSENPVEDGEAVLAPDLRWDSDCMMMYIGGNPHQAHECEFGKGVLLSIDGENESLSTSWQSPSERDFANSVVSLWCQNLSAKSHTIVGEFFSNNDTYPVTISHRQILVLAFPRGEKYDHVLKVANQVADAWKIRLRAYDQLNLGRLSNCTIYLYDGGETGRRSPRVLICIYNGAYSQQLGSWYDFNGLGTVDIAMTVSATATGTSLVYAYLEILVPGSSTYNFMVITFEVS